MALAGTVRRLALASAAAGVLGAAIMGIMGAGTLGVPAQNVRAQDGAAVVRVVSPVTKIESGSDAVAFDVNVENARNLGGFQFILTYDDELLEFVSVQKGDFLASTGREVVCNEVTDAPGAIRVNCVTLRPEPAGPDGAGKLATISFKPAGGGTASLELDRVKLLAADEVATELPTGEVVNATVEVEDESSGFNWVLWGPIIGIAVLLGAAAIGLAATRLRPGGKPAAAM